MHLWPPFVHVGIDVIDQGDGFRRSVRKNVEDAVKLEHLLVAFEIGAKQLRKIRQRGAKNAARLQDAAAVAYQAHPVVMFQMLEEV
jgi:hypothetical protein